VPLSETRCGAEPTPVNESTGGDVGASSTKLNVPEICPFVRGVKFA
jgi:hypothetical protein